MFTGIVQAIGRIVRIEPHNGDIKLRVASGDLDLADVQLGDSIATNGVCLTVTNLSGDGYWADVSLETLAHSTIGDLAIGARVNLEKALMPTSRLGGHIVSGHVDGVGEVMAMSKDARSVKIRIRVPAALSRYIAHKGSVCVDGVSLTVNEVAGAEFELNIVPHTLQQTILEEYHVGRKVNLEVDIISRYLERLLLDSGGTDASAKAEKNPLTLGFLAEHGFLKR